MPKQKNAKPIVRREDLVVAVAAARTAWILTDVDRHRSPRLLIRKPGPALSAGRCSSTMGIDLRCIN